MQQIRDAKIDLLTTKRPDMHGRQFKNAADATDPQDFTTFKQVKKHITDAINSITKPIANVVNGLAALVTTGAIPKVTSPGVLGESAAIDDATRFYILGRIFSVGTATPQAGYVIWTHAGAGQDLGLSGTLSLASGGSVSGKNGAAAAGLELNGIPIVLNAFGGGKVGIGLAAPNYALEVQGDINSNGIYRVGGVAGQSFTITLAALTTLGTQGSITFTGGIATGHVNPT